ncbi:hypothetical protein D1007_43009 [Hordeum vulgare]|nr:hypothetical protein D1007_43009 [Hordeum vulgare]
MWLPHKGDPTRKVQPLEIAIHGNETHDGLDLAMLITTPKFIEVMKEWLMMKLLCVVRLSANKWYEYWIQVQNFEGRMVLGKGWEYFCRRHRIVPTTSPCCASLA